MSTSTTPAETTPVRAPEDRSASHADGREAHGPSADEDRWAYQRQPRITLAMVQKLADRTAQLVRVAGLVVLVLLGLGILFSVLDANVHKWLVADVEDAGRWLASPFRQTFMLHDAKLRLALNWGIALVIYAILAPLVGKLVRQLPSKLAGRS